MGRKDQDKAKAFFRGIRRDDLAPVYLFTGEERFMRGKAVDAVEKRVFEGEEPDPFRFERFHGADADAQAIVSSARTVTMFGGKRLIIVNEVEKLSDGAVDVLADYAEKPGKWAYLVLSGAKVDGRKKGWKRLKKAAEVVAFKPFYQDQMPDWLRDRARRAHGFDLEFDAAAYLAEAIGTDMALAERALEKIELRVGRGGKVNAELAQELVADTRERTVFELTDALMRRDLSASLAALSSLLEQGEPPIKVGMMIARQLRILMKIKDGQARGVRGKDLAAAAGVHPFIFKREGYAQATRRFELEELIELHHGMFRADWRMKSSRLKADVILEEVVLAMCQPQEPGERRGGSYRSQP